MSAFLAALVIAGLLLLARRRARRRTGSAAAVAAAADVDMSGPGWARDPFTGLRDRQGF